MKLQHISLLADCPATLIPEGIEVVLPAGTTGLITQLLGGTLTLRTDRGLFRVTAAHRMALPPEIHPLLEPAVPPSAVSEEGRLSEEAVWAALRQCYDPEIPVNIVDLGLIYDLQITRLENGRHQVAVKMTLTAPGCGMGPTIAGDARARIETLPEVEKADVQIVWDPQWTPQMISPEGRKMLGLD